MNDKDQAAIDHVASVSKHPHAAMIVKWLITGWDVRFRQGNGDMCSTTAATWNPDTEYELIEPKKRTIPLVARIAAIDLEAAQWIVDHWDDLLEDRYTCKNNYSRDCDTLSHMFDWEAPPQGADYWSNISEKLGE